MISPGEIVSIFGSGLGPSQGIVAPTPDPGGSYPTSLGDPSGPTIVLFETDPTTDPPTWQAAPILYAQNGQINAVVPFNMNPVAGMAVCVTYNDVTSDSFTVTGAPTDIAIFTVNTSGQGQAAVLNYDATTQTYSLNSATNPALSGIHDCDLRHRGRTDQSAAGYRRRDRRTTPRRDSGAGRRAYDRDHWHRYGERSICGRRAWIDRWPGSDQRHRSSHRQTGQSGPDLGHGRQRHQPSRCHDCREVKRRFGQPASGCSKPRPSSCSMAFRTASGTRTGLFRL